MCPTLWDAMHCNLLSSSVHGVLLVRILEWVAVSFSISTDFYNSLNSLVSKAGILLICPWPVSLAITSSFYKKCNTIPIFLYLHSPPLDCSYSLLQTQHRHHLLWRWFYLQGGLLRYTCLVFPTKTSVSALWLLPPPFRLIAPQGQSQYFILLQGKVCIFCSELSFKKWHFSVDALSLLWHHESCVLRPKESKPKI